MAANKPVNPIHTEAFKASAAFRKAGFVEEQIKIRILSEKVTEDLQEIEETDIEMSREDYINKVLGDLNEYLAINNVDSETRNAWLNRISPELNELKSYHLSISRPALDEYCRIENTILEDLIHTQVTLTCILDSGDYASHEERLKAYNHEIDCFEKRMQKHASRSNVLNDFCILACKVLGALAGILLWPVMPFVLAKGWFDEKRDHVSVDHQRGTLAEAIGMGVLGALVGVVGGAVIGIRVGVEAAKEADKVATLKKANQINQRLSNPETSPAFAASQTIQKFRLFAPVTSAGETTGQEEKYESQSPRFA